MASPYIRHRRVENLVLVRERDRRRVRQLGWMLLGVLPLAMALLGYTWLQAEIVHTGYEVRSLERQLEHLSRDERLLKLDIALLSSPERVVEAASVELGMVFPSIEQTVFLETR